MKIFGAVFYSSGIMRHTHRNTRARANISAYVLPSRLSYIQSRSVGTIVIAIIIIIIIIISFEIDLDRDLHFIWTSFCYVYVYVPHQTYAAIQIARMKTANYFALYRQNCVYRTI